MTSWITHGSDFVARVFFALSREAQTRISLPIRFLPLLRTRVPHPLASWVRSSTSPTSSRFQNSVPVVVAAVDYQLDINAPMASYKLLRLSHNHVRRLDQAPAHLQVIALTVPSGSQMERPQAFPARSTNQDRSLPAKTVAMLALVILLAGLAYVALGAMRHDKAPANDQIQSLLSPPRVAYASSVPPSVTPTAPVAPPPSLTPLDDSGASGIFFLRKRDIWLTNLDGSDQKQLTHSGAIDHYFWVPKSQLLVYEDSRADGPQPPKSRKFIFVETINTLNLATQKVEIIHKSTIHGECQEGEDGICPDFFFALDVSPDGKIIFGGDFLGDPVESKREGVPKGASRVIFHPDTRLFEPTTKLPTQDPMSFLPDGSVAGWAEDDNIFTYSFETKTRTQWTHYPSRLDDYNQHHGNTTNLPTAFHFIGWSPDASRIFFTCGTSGYSQNVLNACETSLANVEIKKLLTDRTEVNPTAAFAMSADRRYFYFQSESRIEKIDTATGESVPIAFPAVVGVPVPSPSGKIMLFTSYVGRDSLWLMNADGSNKRSILTDAQNFQWRF